MREVVAKIVKFASEAVGLVTALLFEPLRLVIAIAAAGVNQYPISLPDREGAALVGSVKLLFNQWFGIAIEKPGDGVIS